jgi:uncharacterized protein
MSKIVIGKSSGHNVGFDLDELLTTRLLITANSGGGKSFLVRRILEQAFGKIQCFVIDVAGEFATLREKYGYVLVGEHGETPVDIRSAGLVAEKLLELRASAVFDLYSLKPPAHRHTWVKHFLAAMMNAPKKLWHPVLVIVDEAHKFMPENGEGESEAKDEMLSLCSDGRKYGYCAILPTQRLAKLDKSGASELLNVMVGPTFIDVDLQRAHKALGIVRTEWAAFDEQMKTVAPGNFWALGRAISKKRILIEVGDVATTHPKPGAAHSAEPPPPPEKVKGLLPKLADLPQVAETKARTEVEMRREIRDLNTKLAIAQKQKAVPAQVVKGDPRQARIIQQLRTALEDAKKLMAKFQSQAIQPAVINMQQVEAAVKDAVTRIVRLSEQSSSQQLKQFEQLKREAKPLLDRLQKLLDMPISATPMVPASALAQAPNEIPAQVEPPSIEGITRPQSFILSALAEFQAIGLRDIARAPLAARSGASPNSSSFANNLSSLRTKGLVEFGAGKVQLTTEGAQTIGSRSVALTPEEMRSSINKLLTSPQRLIMDALYNAWPSSLTRDELAEKVGASSLSSSFGNNLSAMRAIGVVDYGPKKTIVLQKWVLLEEEGAA